MLRRYTSLGLQNLQLENATSLLGSSSLCDIVVKGTNVAERHALIEYHPVTRSFWIRDLGTLGGTFVNENILYGMTELKTADILRFGKSGEYIFDMPLIQPTPEKSRRTSSFRHSQCADAPSDGIALPVVGNKIFPKNRSEKFSRATVSKKLCQQPPARSSDSEGITPKSDPNVRPISTKQQQHRSLSLGRSNSVNNNGSVGKLPYLKGSKTTGSSGYRSTETAAFLSQFNGSGGGKKGKNAVGTTLVQRVVRLQNELKRKDEEIAKLKENALLPSTTGDRIKGTLDEYRISLAQVRAENEKLRAIISQENTVPSDNVIKELNQQLSEAENARKLQEIVFQTFFTVAVGELEDINKTVSLATIRDYSDIISEVVKLLQDPFSFRLMEITTKCNKLFQKENVSKQQKQELAEMFDKFLKQTIYPLSKALDIFLPVIKDTAVMARDSARACTLFSQWSREFAEGLREGLTWEIMIYKAEELQNRFRENGIPKFWLCPSIIPLFKTIVEQFKQQVPRYQSMVTDTSRSDPAAIGAFDQHLRDNETLSILRNEVEQKNLELKKTKTKVSELRKLVDQLHTEKEELINQLSVAEDTKFSLDKSSIRARRSANNMDSPSVPIIIPKIELQESQDAENDDQEHNRGNTPEELQELIEKHEEDASPPSEVSETNTIDEFEKLEEEAALIESNDAEGDEVSGDADDEISLATPRIDDGEKKHGIEEELVDGESVVEFNDGIDPGDENLNDAENNVETESLKSHQGSETQKIEIFGTQEKMYDDETERSQAEAPTFDNASDNEINDGGVLANFKTDKDIEDQFVADEDENISRPKINTSNNETDENEEETSKPEIIAQNDSKEMLEKNLDEIKGENKDEPDGAEDENISQNETARSNFSEKKEENQKINEQEKTIIEFWHLATALASLLRLKVPEEGEIVDEHERRKTTLDKILEEMQKLLIQFRNDDALN